MVQKIILVGYMGSGKSTIGELLSKKIQLPYIDLDSYLEEKENLSISEIFSQKGEIYFRAIESRYFRDLVTNQNSFVLSLGGGTACYAHNHLQLQNTNVQSIYLKTNIETIFIRLKSEKNTRPLITNKTNEELKEFIAKHLFERSYFYNFCKLKVNTDNKNAEQLSDEILSLIL